MAYEKNIWYDGDIVTAEKLNHIEDGISESGGGSSEVLVIGELDKDKPFDYSGKEIYNAIQAGKRIAIRDSFWENKFIYYYLTNAVVNYVEEPILNMIFIVPNVDIIADNIWVYDISVEFNSKKKDSWHEYRINFSADS